jgi:hypothetical protein
MNQWAGQAGQMRGAGLQDASQMQQLGLASGKLSLAQDQQDLNRKLGLYRQAMGAQGYLLGAEGDRRAYEQGLQAQDLAMQQQRDAALAQALGQGAEKFGAWGAEQINKLGQPGGK